MSLPRSWVGPLVLFLLAAFSIGQDVDYRYLSAFPELRVQLFKIGINESYHINNRPSGR